MKKLESNGGVGVVNKGLIYLKCGFGPLNLNLPVLNVMLYAC